MGANVDCLETRHESPSVLHSIDVEDTTVISGGVYLARVWRCDTDSPKYRHFRWVTAFGPSDSRHHIMYPNDSRDSLW